MKTQTLAAALALSALFSACDETDAVALRIHVRPDLSGTFAVSGLERPAEGARAPIETKGVDWKSRVDLRCAAGDFSKLAELAISDISLSAGETQGGLCFLRLSLPRGAEVHWAHELVPLSAAERKAATAAVDSSGTAPEVGSTIKFEVTLPSDAVGNGVVPRPRGTKVKAEGAVATLVVPVEAALSPGDPIVWHLTWQK